MELVDTLFASLSGTDPFTGVDITIANCKSTYWDEGIVQQLINQVLDEGEKFATANQHTGMKALFSNSLTRSWMKGKSSPVLPVLRDYLDTMSH